MKANQNKTRKHTYVHIVSVSPVTTIEQHPVYIIHRKQTQSHFVLEKKKRKKRKFRYRTPTGSICLLLEVIHGAKLNGKRVGKEYTSTSFSIHVEKVGGGRGWRGTFEINWARADRRWM